MINAIPIIDFTGLPIIVLVLALAQVITPAIFFRQGGFQFADDPGHDPPIVPAGYAFTIWGLIYLASIAYGIYQVLPGQLYNPGLADTRFYTALAFLGAAAWIILARFKRTWSCFICILTIWAALGCAFIEIQNGIFSLAQSFLIVATISIFFGWVTIAMFANLAAALKASGVMTDGKPEVIWSIVLLIIAGAGAGAIIFYSGGNIWYTLTILWALIAIVVANYKDKLNKPVAITAVILAILAVVVFIFRPLG